MDMDFRIPLLEPERCLTAHGMIHDLESVRHQESSMRLTNHEEELHKELPVSFHRDAGLGPEPDEHSLATWLPFLRRLANAGELPPPEYLWTCGYNWSTPKDQAEWCAQGCSRLQSELFTADELAALVRYMEASFGSLVNIEVQRVEYLPNTMPELDGDPGIVWGEWYITVDPVPGLEIVALARIDETVSLNLEKAALTGDVERTQRWHGWFPRED